MYLDPPYVPLSSTANFTAYHQTPFGMDEHRRLARVFTSLAARGVFALLSNSDTGDTRALYGAHEIQSLRALRAINSRASGRGPVRELLVIGRSEPAPRRNR